MSSRESTKAEEVARATKLIAGIQKHFAGASLTLASTVYTAAQITAALQLLVDLQAALDTAKSMVKAKLTAQKAQAPALHDLLVALVSYVKLTFSNSPDVLADFGISPKKVATPLTTAQQVVANARGASTRTARGTTSKKAKQAIRGDVVDVVMTPVKAGQPVASSSLALSSANTPPTGGAAGNGTSHGA